MVCNNQKLRLFFETTSIRGFSRIVRTENNFIKCLWIIFVITTTLFLGYSVYKIVADFLLCSVNIQTSLIIDHSTRFPAVTFCNHQPFSENAYRKWKSKEAMSPTSFNKKLRQTAYNILTNESLADNPFWTGISRFLGTTDSVGVYYQQLSFQLVNQLGHNKSIIHNCMFMYGKKMAVAKECEDSSLIVRKISLPRYFNCFTIEAGSLHASLRMNQLGLIVYLGPPDNVGQEYRQGGLTDIFDQAYGLRVVIHEPGAFPDIDRNGIQIEPGKMNEINYQAVQYKKANTLRNKCVYNDHIKYRDLTSLYNYDLEHCFNDYIQKKIVSECKCLYAQLPRVQMPTPEIPYCGSISFKDINIFVKRFTCLTELILTTSKIKQSLGKTKCFPRCDSDSYESTVSVTKWRAPKWQMYWLVQQENRWKKYSDALENNDKEAQKKYFKDVIKYLQVDNFIETANKTGDNITFDDRYTFVMVKRRSNNTYLKEEKLVLTVNALFSRIGGLCSLYIGMTLAVFVELIEFSYTVTCGSTNKRTPEKNTDNCAMCDVDSPEDVNSTSKPLVMENISDNRSPNRKVMFNPQYQCCMETEFNRRNKAFPNSVISNGGISGSTEDNIWVPNIQMNYLHTC